MNRNGIRLGLLLLAVLCVGVGLWLGQPGQVMQKAVRICLECVGIG